MAEPVGLSSTPTRRIDRTCRCYDGGRRPPLRVHVAGIAILAALLGRREAGFSQDELETIVLDYLCAECKALVYIRLRDLLGT